MGWRACISTIAAATILSLPSRAVATPREALDWAFRFASAIVADEVDQAKAQEKVLTDYLLLGEVDEALQRVGKIANWRKGTAWADIAVALADRGRTDEAVTAIRNAESIRLAMRGDWQSDRIGAHIARAYARHGDLLMNHGVRANLPAEESVKANTGGAYGMVSRGEVTEAFAMLREIEGEFNFDVLSSLAEGYVELARHPALTNQPDRRQEALDGARRVLGKLPFVRRAQLVDDIAREYRLAGNPSQAREVLEQMEAELKNTGSVSQDDAPIYSWIAVEWAELNESERARKHLETARRLALTGDPLEQPATCAVVAECFVRVGDRRAATELNQKGLAIAAGFVNARPRALAVVEICRSWGRQRVELDESTHRELAALFGGLADPW